MTLPSGLVSFMMVKLTVGPVHSERVLLQLPCVGAATGWADVAGAEVVGNNALGNGVAVRRAGSIVDVGSGVEVDGSVGLAVSVGGTGVLVGIAAWVCATIVKAAASAVCWTSNALVVGAACGAQALTRKIVEMTRINIFCFIGSYFLKLNVLWAILLFYHQARIVPRVCCSSDEQKPAGRFLFDNDFILVKDDR